jgi:hypothetical protein
MSAEVRELVDRRWDEYGLATVVPAPTLGISQSSRRLLRR